MKSRPPRLLLALSAHGYGHLAQCAPVINVLQQWQPELSLTVCGGLPREVVAARIDSAFDYCHAELDPVLHMLNAWEVDLDTSRHIYRRFHRDWEHGYQHDLDLLERVSPDLVLADIPYRILSAADRCGIPAVALCSLNWAAIYAAYCEDSSEDRRILEQIMDAYGAADLFLAPVPAMAMPGLDNVVSTGPIARQGSRQQEALRERCAVERTSRLVLVALGGVASRLPLENWPLIEGVSWIIAEAVREHRHDLVGFSSLDMRFIDVLASVDAVLTKPGYGTYAEAVCHGVPILTIARPDWPETIGLNNWARQHGHLEEMTREQFLGGDFAPLVNTLLEKGRAPAIEPEGIRQAVDHVQSLLL